MLIVALLIYVAYVLFADRKIWAAVQLRRGPNVVGPWGLFQSFADLLKFVLKEPIIPASANKGVFLLAPLVTGALAISAWAVIPVDQGWAISNLNVGILYIFADLVARGLRRRSWPAGRRTRNTRSSRPCARPPRWCPTRFRSASCSSRCCCAPGR